MKKVLWVLLDSRTGSVGQARGVIQQLNPEKFEIIEKKLDYNKLSGLPNFIRGKTLIGLTPQSKKQIMPEWPDLVLSTSRRTVPIARYIKKQNARAKLIQLMYPGRTGLREFELAIVPEHDKNKTFYPNIRYIVGSPHRTTPQTLQEAREKWQDTFSALPKPLTALIIGGAIKGSEFSIENAKKLALSAKALVTKEGGSLLVTTSRRTGKKAEAAILKILEGIPTYNYLWGSKNDNPYLGFLACADRIIVTGDSVSMCSEACGSGKPVLVFTGRHWLSRKHIRFIASLYKNGYAAALKKRNFEFKPKGTLNAAIDAAKFIEAL